MATSVDQSMFWKEAAGSLQCVPGSYMKMARLEHLVRSSLNPDTLEPFSPFLIVLLLMS